MVLTIVQCATLLEEWLQSHCNAVAVKRMCGTIGYRTSTISPAHLRHLVEEMVFLYVGLAIRSCRVAWPEQGEATPLIKAFLDQLHSDFFKPLIAREPQFESRYEQRMRLYSGRFRNGAEAMEIGREFLLLVYGRDSEVSSEASVEMATAISAALTSLRMVLTELDVSG